MERTRLPDSRREAEETEREAVLESQMVWEEPLRRRRVPEERKRREAEESTGVVPAVQTGTPPA